MPAIATAWTKRRRWRAQRRPQVGSGPRWFARAVGPGHKLGGLVVAAALLALGALLGVAWAAGFDKVAHVLVHPHWAWLPPAVAAEVVAYLGYTFAYREVARAEDGAELGAPGAAALVTTGFGVFLQGGGFALDREALRRAGLSDRESRQRVLALGMLEYGVLAPAAAVAALLVYLHDDSVSSSLTLPWVIGVPAGSAVAAVALRCRKRLGGRRGWRARLGHALSALGFVLGLLRSSGRARFAAAGIGAYWLGDVFCLWAALHVFAAQPPPVAQLLLGYATGYALTRRALPLGGAGVVECLLPFALGWVRIPLPQALLAVVLYRAVNLWLPMIPALASIPALARLETRSQS
jgi:uncharacterized membrane protein YbhN (UPF0104 family)